MWPDTIAIRNLQLPGWLRQQLFLPTETTTTTTVLHCVGFFNENQMLLGTAKSCPCVGVQLSVTAHSPAALGRRKCATAIVRERERGGAAGEAAMASVLVKNSSL